MIIFKLSKTILSNQTKLAGQMIIFDHFQTLAINIIKPNKISILDL